EDYLLSEPVRLNHAYAYPSTRGYEYDHAHPHPHAYPHPYARLPTKHCRRGYPKLRFQSARPDGGPRHYNPLDQPRRSDPHIYQRHGHLGQRRLAAEPVLLAHLQHTGHVSLPLRHTPHHYDRHDN